MALDLPGIIHDTPTPAVHWTTTTFERNNSLGYREQAYKLKGLFIIIHTRQNQSGPQPDLDM